MASGSRIGRIGPGPSHRLLDGLRFFRGEPDCLRWLATGGGTAGEVAVPTSGGGVDHRQTAAAVYERVSVHTGPSSSNLRRICAVAPSAIRGAGPHVDRGFAGRWVAGAKHFLAVCSVIADSHSRATVA